MPHVPTGWPPLLSSFSSSAIFPAAFRVSSRPSTSTLRPAESYPRYSRRWSPSTSRGAAGRCPTYPTIPHIRPRSTVPQFRSGRPYGRRGAGRRHAASTPQETLLRHQPCPRLPGRTAPGRRRARAAAAPLQRPPGTRHQRPRLLLVRRLRDDPENRLRAGRPEVQPLALTGPREPQPVLPVRFGRLQLLLQQAVALLERAGVPRQLLLDDRIAAFAPHMFLHCHTRLQEELEHQRGRDRGVPGQ